MKTYFSNFHSNRIILSDSWGCLDLVNNSVVEHQDLQEMEIVDIEGNPMGAAERFDIGKVPAGLRSDVTPAVGWLQELVQHLAQPHPPADTLPDEEPEVYFYHSDHLGSASWITDKDGNPVQHLQYLPYGEPYVNHRVSGYLHSPARNATRKRGTATSVHAIWTTS